MYKLKDRLHYFMLDPEKAVDEKGFDDRRLKSFGNNRMRFQKSALAYIVRDLCL